MSPQESVKFELDSAEQCLVAFKNATGKGEYDNALSIAKNGLYFFLEAGMIQWRHQLCNPRQAFENAYEIANKAMEIKDRTTLVTGWQMFDFLQAEMIGYLVNPPGQNPRLERGFQFCTWKEAMAKRKPYAFGNCLDTGLLDAMEKRKAPESWNEYLDHFRPKRKYALFLASFETYMDILTFGGSSVNDYLPLVEKAAANYRKRAKDSGFKNSRFMEAGGEFNDLFVDLRLAAIMRVCLPDGGASVTGDAAIHVWRW
jgi:hypothetical protein